MYTLSRVSSGFSLRGSPSPCCSSCCGGSVVGVAGRYVFARPPGYLVCGYIYMYVEVSGYYDKQCALSVLGWSAAEGGYSTYFVGCVKSSTETVRCRRCLQKFKERRSPTCTYIQTSSTQLRWMPKTAVYATYVFYCCCSLLPAQPTLGPYVCFWGFCERSSGKSQDWTPWGCNGVLQTDSSDVSLARSSGICFPRSYIHGRQSKFAPMKLGFRHACATNTGERLEPLSSNCRGTRSCGCMLLFWPCSVHWAVWGVNAVSFGEQ